MRNSIANLVVIALVSLMCMGTIVALPLFIEMQEHVYANRTAAASGPVVPAALPASPPPPCDNTRFLSSTNLNHGPGRGLKTANGPGRSFDEVGYE